MNGLVSQPGRWWAVPFAVLVVGAAATTYHFDVGPVTVRPEHIALAMVILTLVIPFRDDVRWGWPEWALAAFLGFQVLPTLLHAPDPAASFRALGQEILGAVAYLVTSTVARTPDRLVTAFRVFLGAIAATTAVGLLALVSCLVLSTSWGVAYIGMVGGFTVNGLAAEHNLFGSTALAGAIAFGVLWAERSSILPRPVVPVGLFICLLGVAASLTRGAWLGFGVAVAVGVGFAVWRRREGRHGDARAAPRHRATTAMAFGLSVLVAAGLLDWGALAKAPPAQGSFPTTPAPVQAGVGGSILDTETVDVRTMEWRDALSDVRRSAIFGLGTNTFPQRHAWPVARGPDIPLFLSNILLRPLYDAGAVGLVLFLAFLVPLLWPDRRLREGRGPAGTIARALVLAWIGLMVAYVFTDATILVWPWISLGLIRAARALAGPSAFAPDSR